MFRRFQGSSEEACGTYDVWQCPGRDPSTSQKVSQVPACPSQEANAEVECTILLLTLSTRVKANHCFPALQRRIRKATEETIQIQKQHAEDKVNWERKLEQLRREEACYLTMIQFADDKREMRARMAQKEAEEETQHKIQCIALMEQYVRAKYNISSVQPSMLLA